MTVLISPINISFYNWACQLDIDLPQLDVPTPPKEEEKWREWAQSLFASNSKTLVSKGVPLPSQDFKSWQDWAAFFVGSF